MTTQVGGPEMSKHNLSYMDKAKKKYSTRDHSPDF